jgi:hypothetical protein
MMNDEEFRQFLKELRSSYGLPPLTSAEDPVAYEDIVTEDDEVSQEQSLGGRWRQED